MTRSTVEASDRPDGWSGGGSLSSFYQDQAEHPTIRETPAGDPADLVAANLIPADGVMYLAAHLSRAHTLTEWIDPSITDEANPFDRDPDSDQGQRTRQTLEAAGLL